MSHFPILRTSRPFAATTLLLALLAACGGGGSGGGGDDAGGTPQATSFTRGAITGFGSVIVNGVRFDDDAADVEDDDGSARSRDDLRLGMEVEIEGGTIREGRGSARQIRIGSALLGPVQAVDSAAGTLTLLDQTVKIVPTTVFDDDLDGALAAVRPGDLLEVHAQYDASAGVYTASRVDDEDDARFYKLRGVVTGLDTAAQTFRIGTALLSYAGLGTSFSDGQTVRLSLRTVKVDGAWEVAGVRDTRPARDDHDDAEIEGRITAFVSGTSFSVDGIEVDARDARFDDGRAGLALGTKVEVEGSLVAGVLVARKVEIDSDDDDGSDDASDDDGDDDGFELHGAIASLDTAARTFELRGVTVSYAGGVRFDDLREDQLADGLKVEVKGRLSADGTDVVATRIERDD